MNDTKRCRTCGNVFHRNQSRVRWRRAKFCSRECAGVARRVRFVPGECEWCGVPFADVRWATAGPSGNRHRFCGSDCYATYRRHNGLQLRECSRCGRLMHRRRMPRGSWETRTEYRRRRWCLPKCPPATRLVVEHVTTQGPATLTDLVDAFPGIRPDTVRRAVYATLDQGKLHRVGDRLAASQ